MREVERRSLYFLRFMIEQISVPAGDDQLAKVYWTEQKYLGKWREAIEAEMNFRHSETYRRPTRERYLV